MLHSAARPNVFRAHSATPDSRGFLCQGPLVNFLAETPQRLENIGVIVAQKRSLLRRPTGKHLVCNSH